MAKEISSADIERGYPRTAGLLLIALGAALLFWLVWLPARDALQGAAQIHISLKGTVVGTALLLLGLLKFIFGSAVTPFLKPEGDESKAPAIIIAILILGTGFGTHHAFKDYLQSRGYALDRSPAPRTHIVSTQDQPEN